MNNLYAHIDTLNERIRELEEGLQEIVAELTWNGKHIWNINEEEKAVLDIATRLITVSPSADSLRAVTPTDRETQKNPILDRSTGGGTDEPTPIEDVRTIPPPYATGGSCDRETGGDDQTKL